MIENYIDVHEVAEMLEITTAAVHRLCARGSLPFLWLSGRRIFVKNLVIKYKLDPNRDKLSRRLNRKEVN